jgi:hypothetical protein
MTLATDPIDYAEVDKNDSNSSPLPLPQAFTGWADGDFYLAADQNALHQNGARWKAWLDQTRAPSTELGYRTTFRTSAHAFQYPLGPGLVGRIVQFDSHVIVAGTYVSLTLARLAYRQPTIHTHTFTANSTEHFYIATDGTITSSVVALGTPPAPPVGLVTLVSHDTNGTSITATTVAAAFLDQKTICDAPSFFTAAVTAQSSLSVTGGNLTIDKPDALARRLAFTNSADAAQGWQLEHTATENLRFRELVPKGGGGTATTVLDLGAPGTPTTPATFSRPLAISSAETLTGIAALAVLSTNFQGPGSTMQTDRTATLTLNATGTGGVPLVLVPRPIGFTGGTVVGAIQINDDAASNLEYKDNNGNKRTTWATKGGGLSLDSSYSATAVNNFAVAQNYSFNYAFVSGQRYRVRMGVRVGRAAGSTRDAQISCTVGGVSLVYSGQTVFLFQAGGATQLEALFAEEAVFVAGVTGTLAVQLTVSPVNGAGNLNLNYRGLLVEGHYD